MLAEQPFIAETENWRAGECQEQAVWDTHESLEESQGQAIDRETSFRQNESV